MDFGGEFVGELPNSGFTIVEQGSGLGFDEGLAKVRQVEKFFGEGHGNGLAITQLGLMRRVMLRLWILGGGACGSGLDFLKKG